MKSNNRGHKLQFWLNDQFHKELEELVEQSGCSKQQVINDAVRFLHDYSKRVKEGNVFSYSNSKNPNTKTEVHMFSYED